MCGIFVVAAVSKPSTAANSRYHRSSRQRISTNNNRTNSWIMATTFKIIQTTAIISPSARCSTRMSRRSTIISTGSSIRVDQIDPVQLSGEFYFLLHAEKYLFCLHFNISMKIAARGIQCGRVTCLAVATMTTFPETHETLTPGGNFVYFR